MTSPQPETWDHVARNLENICETIEQAAAAANREPAGVRLVAVSKTFPVEAIRAALAAGHTLFGENRIQEALPKIDTLTTVGASFHLIGHLQSNKARHAGEFGMVESVDSIKLARAIDKRLDHPLPILLEVNVSGEASKNGFRPDDLDRACTEIQALPKLNVQGLMTVAPLAADPEEVRPYFRQLRELRDALGLQELSMGMTNDFPVAIEEGATIVRIGRAIFGDR
jgi:pyridoxal phosphate enzyme (YggS family)